MKQCVVFIDLFWLWWTRVIRLLKGAHLHVTYKHLKGNIVLMY